MSATPIQYSSTDASAPVLTGQSGSLISLLRAILVTGYGAKSGAGWTEPYSAASNVAVFRNSLAAGTGMHLWVNDNNLASGKTAAVRGFLNMSDLNTGTDAFPSVSQQAAGLYLRKSESADSTARAWWALACRKWIYLLVNSSTTQPAIYFFGDIRKVNTADAWNCIVTGGVTLDPNTSTNRMLFHQLSFVSSPTGSNTGLYFCRSITGLSNTSDVGAVWPSAASTTRLGQTSLDNYYPATFGGGLMFEDVLVASTSPTLKMPPLRGRMPNMYNMLHSAGSAPTIPPDTVFNDLPAAGKTMICKWYRPSASTTDGAVLFDLSSEG